MIARRKGQGRTKGRRVGVRVLAEDDGSSSGEQGVDVREVDVSYPSPPLAYPFAPSPVPISSDFPSFAIPCAISATSWQADFSGRILPRR